MRQRFVLTAVVVVAAAVVGSVVFLAQGPQLVSGLSREVPDLLKEGWFNQSGFALGEWVGASTDRWIAFERGEIVRALVFGALGLVSLVVCVTCRRRQWISLGAGILFAATLLVDVGLVARRYYVSQPEASLATTEGIGAVKDMLGRPGRWRIGNLEAEEAALPSNTQQIYGIPAFGGINAVFPSAHAERLRLVMSAGDVTAGMGAASGLIGDVACVKLLVAADTLESGPRDRVGPGYRPVYHGDMHVYENQAAWPKGVCIERDLITAGFLPGMPGGGPPTLRLVPLLDRLASSVCGRCDVVGYEPEKVELEVSADKDCFLLFQDTYYPGWVADIDGMRQPILRTDLGFRAVALGAGQHTVVMTFRPLSVKLGLGLTCLGIILSIVYGTKKRFWKEGPEEG